MEISFNCQYCDAYITLDGKYADKKIKCPECGLSITVPAESGERQYVIAKRDGNIGPIRFIDMADMVNKGTLKGGDKVALFGSNRFKPVKQYQEFSGLAKIALKKGTKRSTFAMIMTILKLGIVAGLIVIFFVAKNWWEDKKVAGVQEEIYANLKKKKRKALSQAVKEYEIMKKKYPNSDRTEETRLEIEITRNDIIKKEIEEYNKIKENVEKLASAALEYADNRRFPQAYRMARKVSRETKHCRKLRVLRKGEYKEEYNKLRRLYNGLKVQIDEKRKAYIKERLEQADAMIVLGNYDGAKDILYQLSRMDLPPHYARAVTKKMTKISRFSSGSTTVQKVQPKKPKPKDTRKTEDVIDDLKSRNAARRKKAFEIIATTGKKPEGDANEIFFAAAENAFGNRDLYFPALDAVLVVGDSGGRMFGKIFENYQKHTEGGKNRKGMTSFSRNTAAFTQDLVSYICRHGGMDKGVFLKGLLEDPNLASGILNRLPGNIEIKDLPNLRRGIEKIIIYSEDGAIVKNAIAALGKLKSRESLDMLIKIVDYTTCSKCSFGGTKSGHMYNYTNLFCARCRETRSYHQKGSIFYVTLQAIREIGSSKPLQILRKIKDREHEAGHRNIEELIGAIIEDITKSS